MERSQGLIKIVTDSTADLPPELAAKWGITVIPCLVHFGQETYREGGDLSHAEFYRRLVSGQELPTTSSPGPGVFAATYRQLAVEASQIVSIHLSSKLSAVYNAARLGAQEIRGAEVRVVDSGTVTMGLGWLAVMAARASQVGASLVEIVQLVEAARTRTRVFALLDTLEYLRRSGRVNRLVAVLGALLDVKPMLSVEGGDVLPLARVRSRRKAISQLLLLVQELGPLAELAVLHSRAQKAAEDFADRLAAVFPRQRMVIAEVATVLGTHVGPNGLGVACVVAE
jgi:DegV family protein with EDD domain